MAESTALIIGQQKPVSDKRADHINVWEAVVRQSFNNVETVRADDINSLETQLQARANVGLYAGQLLILIGDEPLPTSAQSRQEQADPNVPDPTLALVGAFAGELVLHSPGLRIGIIDTRPHGYSPDVTYNTLLPGVNYALLPPFTRSQNQERALQFYEQALQATMGVDLA